MFRVKWYILRETLITKHEHKCRRTKPTKARKVCSDSPHAYTDELTEGQILPTPGISKRFWRHTRVKLRRQNLKMNPHKVSFVVFSNLLHQGSHLSRPKVWQVGFVKIRRQQSRQRISGDDKPGGELPEGGLLVGVTFAPMTTVDSQPGRRQNILHRHGPVGIDGLEHQLPERTSSFGYEAVQDLGRVVDEDSWHAAGDRLGLTHVRNSLSPGFKFGWWRHQMTCLWTDVRLLKYILWLDLDLGLWDDVICVLVLFVHLEELVFFFYDFVE